MKIGKSEFGKLKSGEKATLFTIANESMSIAVSDVGAAWIGAVVPSRSQGAQDVILGYPSAADYQGGGGYFGATVGRFANRIGRAAFSLGGKTYKLPPNEGQNSLHGGSDTWAYKLWAYEVLDDGLRFSFESPDGDGGFPGNVKASVCYRLNRENKVIIDFKAETDAPCPINMTNHAYFNLKGEDQGDILAHRLRMRTPSYLEVDAESIPTGKILPTAGGPMDFSQEKEISRDIAQVGSGYDHCFVIDKKSGELAEAAEVFEPESGRGLRVLTTQPGIQLYTGNFIKNQPGKGGNRYQKHAGFCLETQDFPDAPNKPNFPSCVVPPGKAYAQQAIYAFSW